MDHLCRSGSNLAERIIAVPVKMSSLPTMIQPKFGVPEHQAATSLNRPEPVSVTVQPLLLHGLDRVRLAEAVAEKSPPSVFHCVDEKEE